MLSVNLEKGEVVYSKGKFGTELYTTITFKKVGNTLEIDEEDYGGGCCFEIPFSLAVKAIDVLKTQPKNKKMVERLLKLTPKECLKNNAKFQKPG